MPSLRAKALLYGGALVLLLGGCATYRDDLDRAMLHYSANEYDQALALLEVLEIDTNSLAEAERAQYAYYRGMAHFRLKQRLHARHWLGVAAAREKATAGSLSVEEKKRVDDTLAELNKDRWGGPASVPEVDKCRSDLDCVKGEICDAGTCKKLAPPAAEGTDGVPTPAAKPEDAGGGQKDGGKKDGDKPSDSSSGTP